MDYFWHWRPEESFPPQPVCQSEELRESDRLNVACTQTRLPPRRQQVNVTAWCERLPTLANVRFLWLTSRAPQRLFEAACCVPRLEGLYVKWSGITDLEPLRRAKHLRYFHLGQSARLDSIEPLGEMRQLRWLGLELLSRIRDLDVVGRLVDLEGLSLQGSMGTTWRIRTLAPLQKLEGLRYLSSRESSLG